MSLDQLFERYNGDFDTLPGHPVVTWADFELAVEIRKLIARVSELENERQRDDINRESNKADLRLIAINSLNVRIDAEISKNDTLRAELDEARYLIRKAYLDIHNTEAILWTYLTSHPEGKVTNE